ncbi:MAG: glycine zipper 2TM domain-containing protein [Magnetococcus sp. YQC-5]
MKIWMTALIVIGLMTTPLLVRAEGGIGTGVGALGGALVGSLSGPHKNRVENTLIGAVAGGLLGSAMESRTDRYVTTSYLEPSWTESRQVVIQPGQRVVIMKPAPQYIIVQEEWTPRRHHWRDHRRHQWRDPGNHHRRHHWRNWD